MSPAIPSCILCGWVVAERPGAVSWINQFRALVPDPQSGVILTGVGLHDDPFSPTPFAPRHSSARWDQPGYDNRDPSQAAESNQVILVLKHHVVFHESCFHLLEMLMHLDQCAFARLGHICSSLPFPTRGTSMSWGHDYGGLVRIENRNSYPWEDRYSDLVLQEADPMYTADPIHNTEALNILTEQPSAPPQPKQPLLPPKAGHLGSSEGRDPLSLLPLEIRTTIATELSVADYLGTRLASRAMWPIFYYQTWWRKKFYAQTLGHEDRSWFIEAWDAPELLTVMDWRFLYRRTRHDQLSPGLRNRKRIWRLVHNIPNIVALDLEAQQDSPAITSDTASPRMIPRVEARLRPPRRGYESSDGFDGEGCREKFCQTVGIPADAASITVYTVPLGDASYICGLEVADEQGGTARAGYRSNCGLEVHLDGKLRGLVAAVGCRGLHAIQLVMIKNDGKGDGKKTTTTTTTSTTTSAWLGDAKADCPKTERLVSTGERVTHIEAHFDGCKMVSLTASFANASTTTTTPQTLRNSAFWYPQIPGPQLYLNDNPALNKDCFMSEYQPIFWTHFGGPGGCRLNHLTGVGVLLHLHEGIAKVEFYYDDSLEKDENTLTMGRHQSCEGAEMMCFAIDGPGGERIREVGVLHRVSSNPSTTTNQDTGPQRPDFLTFKISTNWGRSCLFKTKACSSIDQGAGDKIDMHHIPIEPGTCITGFYAEQKPELGFGVTIVGVISEKVDESTACGTPSAGARRVKRARKPARGRRLLD